MRLKLIFTAMLALGALQAADTNYLVNCEGFNIETKTRVVGTCSQAHFDGNDTVSGKKAYGDCSPGGNLDGYDSETGVAVYGECEGL